MYWVRGKAPAASSTARPSRPPGYVVGPSRTPDFTAISGRQALLVGRGGLDAGAPPRHGGRPHSGDIPPPVVCLARDTEMPTGRNFVVSGVLNSLVLRAVSTKPELDLDSADSDSDTHRYITVPEENHRVSN